MCISSLCFLLPTMAASPFLAHNNPTSPTTKLIDPQSASYDWPQINNKMNALLLTTSQKVVKFKAQHPLVASLFPSGLPQLKTIPNPSLNKPTTWTLSLSDAVYVRLGRVSSTSTPLSVGATIPLNLAAPSAIPSASQFSPKLNVEWIPQRSGTPVVRVFLSIPL